MMHFFSLDSFKHRTLEWDCVLVERLEETETLKSFWKSVTKILSAFKSRNMKERGTKFSHQVCGKHSYAASMCNSK